MKERKRVREEEKEEERKNKKTDIADKQRTLNLNHL